MNRILKTLGFSAILALASLIVASVASATEFEFKLNTSYPLIGQQHGNLDVLTTDSGTVSCTEVTYSGALLEWEVSEFELEPKYSGCTAFGFIGVPVHSNGCRYRFGAETKEGSSFEGKVHFECPTKALEITANFGCVTTVLGKQTPSGTVTYTNVGAGQTAELTVDLNLGGIQYEEHDSDEFPCPGDTENTSNGTFVGAVLVTGESEGGHIGLRTE